MKMEICAPVRITAFALFLLVWHSEFMFSTGNDYCSCYSFHKSVKNWDESKQHCLQQNPSGNLVSMETEEEYQFINETIQNQNIGNNEWTIGLTRTTGFWKWVNGQDLTIDKWQPNQPSGDQYGYCVIMAKNWPPGHLGKFNDLSCYTHKMFICEFKNGIDVGSNEWYIGLTRKRGDWEWISGQSLNTMTNKWLPGRPDGNVNCVKMIKYYKGLGKLDDIKCTSQHMFICEYQTGMTCPDSIKSDIPTFVWCSSNSILTTTIKEYPTTTTSSPTTKVETTTATTTTTRATTAQIKLSNTSSSTEKKYSFKTRRQTEPFIYTATKPKGGTNESQSKTSDSSPFPLEIVAVALGLVLAVCLSLLLFVCYWRRRMNKGDKNKKPISDTTSLPRVAARPSSSINQSSEDGGFPEGVQMFDLSGEPYVAYAVIHNNLTQQDQGPAPSNESAYASIQDESLMYRSSKENDSNNDMPAATSNAAENSGNSVGEVMYASVDKSKKNNEKNDSQNFSQWPSGEQVVYASVDKSKKSNPQSQDAVYAEIGSKDNKEKQQPYQITYAELADFNRNRKPEEAVTPAPYQPAEYAVIVGQKQKS